MMKLTYSKSRRVLPIRGLFVLIFVTSTILMLSVTGIIVYTNWSDSLRNVTKKTTNEVHNGVLNDIGQFIDKPVDVINVNSNHFEKGLVNINDKETREKFFVNVLSSLEEYVYSFSYGTSEGEYYGARRNENNDIEIMLNNESTSGESWYYTINEDFTAGDISGKFGKFDVRTRDWYKAALRNDGIVFSPLYYHFVKPDFTISVSKAIYNENEVKGVLGIHIVLTDIDTYLKEAVSDNEGFALIVEKDTDLLVANTLDIENFYSSGNVRFRNGIDKIDNNVIKEAYKRFKTTGEKQFKYKSTYFYFQHYNNLDLNWITVTAIPESYLMGDVDRSIQLTILITFVIMILSVTVYFILTSGVLKPVDDLVYASSMLSTGDLSKRVIIRRDDELGKISKAFNKMADTINLLVNDLEEKVKERTKELSNVNMELNEKRERLRIILDSTAEGVFGVDVHGFCTFCNKSGLSMLGYETQEELLGKDIHLLTHNKRRDGSAVLKEECNILLSIVEGKSKFTNDEIFTRKDGTNFNVYYNSSPQFKENVIIGAVVTFMDITERLKEEEKIVFLNNHDSLTGLVNKSRFMEMVKEYDKEENLPISIIYADLNGLKLTNDIFGHDAGDDLIRKTSEVISKHVKASDVIARTGGDEFAVLLTCSSLDQTRNIICKIENDLEKEYIQAVKCSVAMGASTKCVIQQEIETVIYNAELEMYNAKSRMKKGYTEDAINTFVRILHERSPENKMHSERVSYFCELIGKSLDFNESDIKKLKEAAYVHDIGKIGIDSSLLNKEILNEDEKQKMQQHSFIGYRILKLFDHTVDYADIVFSHHEKWDGTGYPKGLRGEEIPLMSRIISIAEFYERNLRNKGKEKAIFDLLNESGKRFDPIILENFLKILGVYK